MIEREITRTGVGAVRLMKNAATRPEGLSYQLIQSWLGHHTKTARKDFVEFVLQEWRSLPSDETVKITPALQSEIRDEIERTGKGPSALFRGMRMQPDCTVTACNVKSWLSGNSQTAPRSQLEFVLAHWRSLTDWEDRWLVASDEDIRRIRTELARTGTSIPSLVKRPDCPARLSEGMIRIFKDGHAPKIRRSHYDYILQTLEGLPDKSNEPKKRRQKRQLDRIELTTEMRQELEAERIRTGVTETILLRQMTNEDGAPLPSARMINGWINGYARTAPAKGYLAVLELWRSLPDSDN